MPSGVYQHKHAPPPKVPSRPPVPETDPEILTLIKRAKKGDEQAFEILLAELRPWLRSKTKICCWRKDGMTQEDATQEITLQLWRKVIPAYDPMRCKWGSFVRICLNKIWQSLRQRKNPINGAISLHSEGEDDEEKHNPVSILAPKLRDYADDREQALLWLEKLLPLLSPVEKSCFIEWLQNASYVDASENLAKKDKAFGPVVGAYKRFRRFDNSLGRAVKKLNKLKQEENLPILSQHGWHHWRSRRQDTEAKIPGLLRWKTKMKATK